ncbi:MAG TPA: hypothetical protein VJT74_10310 [Pyrinomonadaceae bacterium]|nr:hypothetical protein [Pyrinomonadaceae bacterium]
MAVIGRLDEQVWEKLIEPIARRHEREAEERERAQQEAAREEEAQAEKDEEAK